jgi:hypothetical protein
MEVREAKDDSVQTKVCLKLRRGVNALKSQCQCQSNSKEAGCSCTDATKSNCVSVVCQLRMKAQNRDEVLGALKSKDLDRHS